jgi:hypothetical protein
VADTDVLSARGLSFSAKAGHAFSGKVATFTDRNTSNVASDFSATINWGDGTTTAGVITDTRGTISVSGTHTYASSGRDTVTVTLTDDAPGTATATARSTATVTGASTALAHPANSADSSGAPTVSDGLHSQSLANEANQALSFTSVGSDTASSATSEGHGGTLITDPPLTNGRSVATDAQFTFGSSGITSFVSNPSLQWLENLVETVVSDLERLNRTSLCRNR